jgi:hypothetical protein
MRSRTHWAYRELEKKLSQRAVVEPIEKMKELPELGTLFLVDPGMRDEIDRVISDELWPAILLGVEASEFRIYRQSDVLKTISTARSPELTRELIFLLEDPVRPLGPSKNPPWYVRGALEARPFTYMLKYDLILEFPLAVNLMALTRLMAKPELSGMPPTLSIQLAHGAGGRDAYVLQLSWGSGGPLGDPRYAPETFITGSVKKHLRIIDAMDRLQDDSYATEGFPYLSSEILAFYGD